MDVIYSGLSKNPMDKINYYDGLVENGLTTEELKEVLVLVSLIYVKRYTDNWFKKWNLITCIKEMLEESE